MKLLSLIAVVSALSAQTPTTMPSASQVRITSPDGSQKTVQDLADPSTGKGAALVAYNANRTVDSKLADVWSVMDGSKTYPYLPPKGDGITDDTAAIQQVINGARAANKAVFFPRPYSATPGSKNMYKITSLTYAPQDHWYGETYNLSQGASATTFLVSSNDWAFKPLDTSSSNTGVIIENLKVLGDTDNFTGPGCMDVVGVLQVTNVLCGVYGSTRTLSPQIDIRSVGGNGGMYSHFKSVVLLGARYGIRAAGTVNANTFDDTRIANVGTCVHWDGGGYSIISGLKCELFDDYGLYVTAASSDLHVYAPYFDTSGAGGVGIFNAGTNIDIQWAHFAAVTTPYTDGSNNTSWDTDNFTQRNGTFKIEPDGAATYSSFVGPTNREARYVADAQCPKIDPFSGPCVGGSGASISFWTTNTAGVLTKRLSFLGGTDNPLANGSTMDWEFRGAKFNGPVNLNGQQLWNAIVQSRMVNLTYSASMTPNLAIANSFIITATNANAFTINAPINMPLSDGMVITFEIVNNSGGALNAAMPWAFPDYRLSANTWTQPSAGGRRLISFIYDGTAWMELSRNPAEI